MATAHRALPQELITAGCELRDTIPEAGPPITAPANRCQSISGVHHLPKLGGRSTPLIVGHRPVVRDAAVFCAPGRLPLRWQPDRSRRITVELGAQLIEAARAVHHGLAAPGD